MKLIVAGSRTWTDQERVYDELDRLHKTLPITEIVSGAAPRGADRMGETWAKSRKVKLKLFPANWHPYNNLVVDRSAGMKRNVEMAKYGDALLAFMQGNTPGTRHMISEAALRGLPTFVHAAGP